MRVSVFLFALLSVITLQAQKTITLTEAEQLFVKNNLLLLAGEYDIATAKAQVVQARIWDLPVVSGELNAINPEKKKLFHVDGQGQKAIAIQQLIYMGGKKKKEIAYAQSDVQLSEMELELLLRNLKLQLAQTFYSIYYDNKKVKTIESQLSELEALLAAYETQAQKGNIALKDVVRLQSLILGLKNEKSELVKALLEYNEKLALLTGTVSDKEPIIQEQEILSRYQASAIEKDSITRLALSYNVEYIMTQKQQHNQQLYLKWQKSLAVPDVTAGLSYDQRGGAFQNQVNLTFALPLPLWNKNKGNIKAAEAQLQQAFVNIDYKKLELQTKVATLWNTWLHEKTQLASISSTTTQNLQSVYDGVIANFRKRNISLLDFTDFMESYNQTINQVNEIKKQWILSGLAINHITSKEIF